MKKYLIIGSVIICGGIFALLMLNTPSRAIPEAVVSEKIQESEVVSTPTPQTTKTSSSNQSITHSSSSPTNGASSASAVSLSVGDRVYDVALVAQDTTLYEIMKSASKESDFSFSGVDYSSLGFFVDTINGQKNTGGKYWILYVNGALATVGVSQLLVKPGDRFDWRYENGK